MVGWDVWAGCNVPMYVQVTSLERRAAIVTVSGRPGAIKRIAVCRGQGRETGPTNGSVVAESVSH